jgi:hypothetical protein
LELCELLCFCFLAFGAVAGAEVVVAAAVVVEAVVVPVDAQAPSVSP